MAKLKKEISVIERRLQSGTVFTAGSRPIPLKEPKRWTIRWVNATISADHIFAMRADKGWEYVTLDDLAVDPVEVGANVHDGKIVKGDKGHEVLMKMPLKDYRILQQHKDLENRKQLGKQKTKEAIVAAAGATHGDQAAAFLQQTDIGVSDSRSVMNLEEEAV